MGVSCARRLLKAEYLKRRGDAAATTGNYRDARQWCAAQAAAERAALLVHGGAGDRPEGTNQSREHVICAIGRLNACGSMFCGANGLDHCMWYYVKPLLAGTLCQVHGRPSGPPARPRHARPAPRAALQPLLRGPARAAPFGRAGRRAGAAGRCPARWRRISDCLPAHADHANVRCYALHAVACDSERHSDPMCYGRPFGG